MESITQVIMEETGELGVDYVLDFGMNDSRFSKKDIIFCLAVHGCWVTSSFGLQVITFIIYIDLN